jgi:hypothetical protein
MTKPRSNIIKVIAVVFILSASVLTIAFSYKMFGLNVTGGFQGEGYSVQGLSFGSSVGQIAVGDPFPSVLDQGGNGGPCDTHINAALLGSTFGFSCDWKWDSASITNPEIHETSKSPLASEDLTASYQTAQPVAECQAGNLVTPSGKPPCPTIDFYSTAANGTKIHQYGWIVSYALSTAVTAGGSTSSITDWSAFQGVTWVNQLAAFYWPNAYSDPTDSSWQGNVFQAPLQLYINDCETGSTGSGSVNTQPCSNNGGPENNVLNPMNAGSQIQLYTDPQMTGSWQNLQCSIAGEASSTCAQSIQTTLNGVVSPSQYFYEGVTYFPITMQDFGNYRCGTFSLNLCSSFTDIHMTLYTILLGSYIAGSTSQITQTQSNNGGGSNPCGTGQTSLFGACLDSASLAVALMAFFLVVAIVVVVLLVVLRRPSATVTVKAAR